MPLRPTASIVALVLCAGVVAGCGGSGGSSAERDRLAHRLAAQTTSLPSDLSSCIVQKARALPIAQLRGLAQSGTTPSGALKPAIANVLASCIQQGKGESALRAVIARETAAALPSTLPASFRGCVESKVRSLSAGQLSQLISVYATAGERALRSRSEQLGRSYGIACLRQPGMLASLRALFLKPIEGFARSSHYSPAFRQCVLREAQRVPAARIEQLALNPATAGAEGRLLGEGFARACIAAGAKP